MEHPICAVMVSRTSVLAAIVRLLELTLFRDGNSEYASPMELWYEDVALPPCSDPGKPYSLELSWQIGIQTKELADHPIIVGSHLKQPRQKSSRLPGVSRSNAWRTAFCAS
jgi:hypothetical protein